MNCEEFSISRQTLTAQLILLILFKLFHEAQQFLQAAYDANGFTSGVAVEANVADGAASVSSNQLPLRWEIQRRDEGRDHAAREMACAHQMG